MNISPDSYLKGARVWVQHPTKVWVGAKVLEKYEKGKLIVLTEDNETKEIKVPTDEHLPPLRNPDILIGQNNLISLSYLHEPAVLHNLQFRFCKNNSIYTYCGIVLVAINPYCDLSIYDSETIWTYRGQAMGDLDPHIFAVAEEAFTKLEREQRDQSIIVSGESGAGKTVSAKYAMRYFATIGGSSTETQVEKKVLAANPIMEAIGNAKTTRNDNSSRFGKYTEIEFDKTYKIIGASMNTYLLEKSRVIVQAGEERNYHIFYQICAARDDLKHLYLSEAHNFNYLSNSNNQIEGVDDYKQFSDTVKALQTLGFSDDIISNLVIILASILHLGNISINSTSKDEGCEVSAKDKHLLIFSSLMNVNPDELRECLCFRRIVSTRESINKPMTANEASGARDAFAKHIYASLFKWIVKQVNRALTSNQKTKFRFIGILDIYGFETFETNSFEQFCINYANEKLQQQFNLHVFKLEQDEYFKEEIEWTFIDFYDNQPCIDLIELKLGILDLLDEECRMPKGSDSSFAEKLITKCAQQKHFSKPRFGSKSFIVIHFADKVEYDVNGFLEKNRDTVIEEQVTLLKMSSNTFVKKVLTGEVQDDNKLEVPKPKVRLSLQQKQPPPSQNTLKNKKTVGSQFRDSLRALMETLNSTTPHYIRCIKPNDEKDAFIYSPSRVVQQLRACGVLETIRISAAGFPSRWLYNEFLNRYYPLCGSKVAIDRENPRATCQKLLNILIPDQQCKFGSTKIFFRAGSVAYLERLRSDKLLEACIKIQTIVRGFLARRRYKRTLNATITIQKHIRGYIARKRVENMRRNKAAVIIQKWIRRWLIQMRYKKTKKTILGLQARCRGYLMRKKFQHMRQTKAAILIQKTIRGWLQRKRYAKQQRRIVICQSAIRRFVARRRVKKMKREAKSAEHLKKLNKGLENKIISLQQKIGEMTKELNMKKSLANEVKELKATLNTKRGIEAQLKLTKSQLTEKDQEVIDLTNLLKMQIAEKDRMIEENKEKEEKGSKEIIKLKKENENLNMIIASKEDVMKEVVEAKQALDEKQKEFEKELNEERLSRQKLLAEKEIYEQRIEALEKNVSKIHKRSSSDASSVSFQEDDIGYGSVRSTASREETPTPEHQIDASLMSKLHRTISALQSENRRLASKFENEAKEANDNNLNRSILMDELEVENSRLKADLLELRESVKKEAAKKTGNDALLLIAKQAEKWEEEAKRARQEAASLRELLGSKTSSTSNLARSSYPAADIDFSLINEDGELVLAFEAQKKTLQQVENELQEKSVRWEIEREELVAEIVRLRDDNDRLSNIVSNNIAADISRCDMYFQSEVKRLISENLDLNLKYDRRTHEYRRICEKYNHLLKQVQEAGVPDVVTKSALIDNQIALPVVKKKDRNYTGMFECRIDELSPMINQLVDLRPHVAVTLLPGLPAYILFMVVRYTDYVNDDDMLQKLILGYQSRVKKVIARRKDLETSILWLGNTLRFVQNLKQYSGELTFAKDNTATQNSQCLQNFDLSEFRQELGDEAVAMCQKIIKKMQDQIQPYATLAILDNDHLNSGITKARSQSLSSPSPPSKLDELLDILSNYRRLLNLHSIDPQLHGQFFMQLFWSLCAHSMNMLLLRKEYCNWNKGMQIRYNLSNFEEWVRDEKINDPRVLEMLKPIIQASQLLQARKTKEDVESVAEMCSALTPAQIMKLLNLYTRDSYENPISDKFLSKMQEHLRPKISDKDNCLMMDAGKLFPLELPFNPSSIRLEDIELPEVLKLTMLRKM